MAIKMKPVEFGRIVTGSVRKSIDIEVGDLILLIPNLEEEDNRLYNKDPVLGIFADYGREEFSDYTCREICFAEEPHKLTTAKLPSGISSPAFTPWFRSWFSGIKCKYQSGGVGWIQELVAGKENVVSRLRADPDHRYEGHVDIIAKMQRPYVNDLEIRKRLELE